MALVKFAFVGLCVFLCLSLSAVNADGASSKPINGDGDDDGDDQPLLPKMMPSGADMHHSSGLRANGFGSGFGYECNMGGACLDPNGPVTVVECPCPGFVSICEPISCYPNPPSYGCQPCNQAQVNMAQKVNMNNGAQDFPKEATQAMTRVPKKQ